jgi:drug/metabolite transporter (DMT)-like permease
VAHASNPHRFAYPALLLGNVALAFGPWLVRLADTGAVAAGFWRLALALPFLWLLARAAGQPVRWPGNKLAIAIAFAAFFFAADLAAWHAGIRLTKLGNATLFGNFASFAFAAYGLWMARKWPSHIQAVALTLAAAGCAALMSGSAELSARHVRGDLLALGAGLLYTGYLIIVERARGRLQPLPLLFLASLFGAIMMLPISLAFGERVMPNDWLPLFVLAFTSQILGQGLLVYALGHVPPLIVGLAFLTQPAISAFIGWVAYGETLTPLDWTGAVAIAVALVLVRLRLGKRAPN